MICHFESRAWNIFPLMFSNANAYLRSWRREIFGLSFMSVLHKYLFSNSNLFKIFTIISCSDAKSRFREFIRMNMRGVCLYQRIIPSLKYCLHWLYWGNSAICNLHFLCKEKIVHRKVLESHHFIELWTKTHKVGEVPFKFLRDTKHCQFLSWIMKRNPLNLFVLAQYPF